ncbi:MAG: 4-hydroxythreonine-4-phosphate dehydrogenase PdxA [Bacteriovoracaceae bacterium]
MILVTQGHENSIGLEVFLKSYIMLASSQRKEIILFTNKKTLEKHLNNLFNSFYIENDNAYFSGATLKCVFSNMGFGHHSESTISLLNALNQINDHDILVTLPTSKDQLCFNNKPAAGYTEFLRKAYSNKDLAMTFMSDRENILLVTDHIALENVVDEVQRQTIHNKILYSLNTFQKYFFDIDRLLISGLNPHAGENELLGKQERVITQAIHNLSKVFPKKKFIGPIPGDSLALRGEELSKVLQVYMYHDQGLSYFKGRNGLLAANITMGLPFLRMSVDHGTAFELFGKNKANPLGCLFVLKKAIHANKRVLENQHENRSHQHI